MEQIYKDIKHLITKYAKERPEDIDYDNIINNDIIFDSIGYISFIIAIEDKYNIQIDDEYLSNQEHKSVKQFLNHILYKIEAK